ncbi:hypothetical protein QQ73_07920, partial [Candidatus Endoriftia persephone str. Guaymas]|nr:hypothetical protein [Candidatus Endoriftia persephone str. Guaymas]
MVRIICRDIAGWAPLGETLEDLSELADITIQQSLVLLYDWTCREMGTPRNAAGEAQSLLVLGMGKLGARELNLSSGIERLHQTLAEANEEPLIAARPRAIGLAWLRVRKDQV